MFHTNQNQRVVVAVEAVDLRKSFSGLQAIAAGELGEQPENGTLFLFSNRRRTRLKVLVFDGTGVWVSTKRLEQGHFSWPRSAQATPAKVVLRPEALQLLLDGVDLRGAELRAWYERRK